MLREQPTMTVEVLDAALSFSIDGFLKLLANFRALSFCVPAMSIDVRNHNREHLGSISELHRAWGPLTRASQHDVCAAQVHLDATYRLAVAIVLCESEYPGEPVAGIRHVAAYQVRKHG